MRYAFGTSALAAQRLKVLADLFAPPSKELLAGAVKERPKLALDLGCGPGYTTHLLADTVQSERTIGLDNSEEFVRLAQRTKTDSVTFLLHDVTSIPFPSGPADLIYCRFLLTHLRDPEAVVARWAAQLRPRGLIVMEEVEQIETQNETFATYLRILADLLNHQSNKLYIGSNLHALDWDASFQRLTSRSTCVPVSNCRAAAMFSLNLQTWGKHSYVQQSCDPQQIHRLKEGLQSLVGSPESQVDIEWTLRQIVVQRM